MTLREFALWVVSMVAICFVLFVVCQLSGLFAWEQVTSPDGLLGGITGIVCGILSIIGGFVVVWFVDPD